MKIIDCKVMDRNEDGTLVRFYLGDDSEYGYHGDDWDDVPYEHNAGRVYDRFVRGTNDVLFPPSQTVIEPCDDFLFDGNSPYSMLDMREGNVPCLAVLDSSADQAFVDGNFTRAMGVKQAQLFYFNDRM